MQPPIRKTPRKADADDEEVTPLARVNGIKFSLRRLQPRFGGAFLLRNGSVPGIRKLGSFPSPERSRRRIDQKTSRARSAGRSTWHVALYQLPTGSQERTRL